MSRVRLWAVVGAGRYSTDALGKLVRRVLDGYDPVVEWSADDPASLEAAQARLRDELDAGYMAVRADGADSEPVTELPTDADMVILTMPMGGG
jgi:hypothetical protein